MLPWKRVNKESKQSYIVTSIPDLKHIIWLRVCGLKRTNLTQIYGARLNAIQVNTNFVYELRTNLNINEYANELICIIIVSGNWALQEL